MTTSFTPRPSDRTVAELTRGFFNKKDEHGLLVDFTVTLQLHQLGGNKRPHFSATVAGHDAGKSRRAGEFGGCNHELILAHWPAAKVVVDLDSSDDEGTPMYATQNGFYYYQVLTGTAAHHTPAKGDDATYFGYLCSHLRVDAAEGRRLVEELTALGDVDKQRERFTAYVSYCRDRWQQEAAAALAFLNANA